MANNPYVNKVIYGNDTVMDISDTTATESDVVNGKTFYKASGAKSTGSAVIPDISNCYQTTDTAETDIQDADYFPFYDSSASGKRKSLWSNIKAKLKTYFDGIDMSYADNIVYGAKNLFDKNRCTYSPNTTLTITETGIRIQGTQGSPAYIYNRTNLSDLPKGKRLKIVADATVTTGSPYVQLFHVFSDYSYTTIDSKAITSGKFEFEFACPPSGLALDICFVEQSGNVDVILENLMLVSATDNDTTYTKYTMSNEGLTDRIQEIVRTGVTASAGGSVRIPASGTDSRIRLNRSIVTPICDQKIVNGVGYPYKFKSCTVSEGYVTIVMAEDISNVDIGIQIVKY